MTEQERLLMSPGPVHVEPSAFACLEPMHHRSGPFREIVKDSSRMLAGLVSSSGKVFLLTMSGTGAMESAIVNLTRRGSRVLVVSGGKFGDRWAEIATEFGCECELLRFGPGNRISAGPVAEKLEDWAPDVICLTHVESSTGLLLEVEEILGELPGPRPLIILDAIASIVSEQLRMDDWGVDLIVGAGQKGLAAPPGISFVIAGERAEKAWKDNPRPSYYMSYSRYLKGSESGDTPFTPAVQSVQILHRSLKSIFEEGPENVRLRHSLYSKVFTDAMSLLGMFPFPDVPSSSVIAVTVPDGIDAAMILRSLKERDGIIITGGQGELEGSIIRTGFLGIYRPSTIRTLAEGIAGALEIQGVGKGGDGLDKILSRIDECGHHG